MAIFDFLVTLKFLTFGSSYLSGNTERVDSNHSGSFAPKLPKEGGSAGRSVIGNGVAINLGLTSSSR
jgi:hypothetical protein